MNASTLVSKLWNYCNVLRDDGLSYGDYVEQLTYLLFLKMADERTREPFNEKSPIPKGFGWDTLRKLDGDDLETHYRHTLEELGKRPGIIGTIFRKAQNKIQDPAKLKRLIADLIDKESWSELDTDVKGDAYEGLLQKNAEDVKGGAGQYFTPRPLIRAIVEVMNLTPREVICDPACGTGGFLLAAHEWLRNHNKLSKSDLRHLNTHGLRGMELVDSVARLCCMNLVLHGVGGEPDSPVPVELRDALAARHGEYDVVLSNPPFGKKSSVTIVTDAGQAERQSLSVHRDDFWATTSNKQLNFVQHIFSILRQHGRAAVVVPDNVLFEGGAGETVRRKLLETTNLHTILRLPTGIFYANGVKANVLFFDNHPARKEAWTREVWIYDYRTNVHHTLKKKPLRFEDMQNFVACYQPLNRFKRAETWHETENPEGRWRKFAYEQIIARDKISLDIFWLKDKSLADLDNLPEPDELAGEIIENLEAGLASFRAVASALL